MKIFSIVLSFACLCTVVEMHAEEAEKNTESADQSQFVFKKTNNNDPFYSAIDIQIAKYEIEEAIRKGKEG